MNRPPSFAIDSEFWRKLARWGASRGPEWLARYAPPIIGCAAVALAPSARRAVTENLRRVRGEASPLRDALDTGRTFASYAACLSEALSFGEKRHDPPRALIHGEPNILAALESRRGAVFATAHTGGWEAVGPLLSRDHGIDVMLVMEPERDEAARAIQDEARRARGHRIVHVGADPLASLPLLRHLRGGGVVALQVDRTPRGMRTRAVTLFGERGAMPEGALRLSQLTGAPIVPIFAARTGYREYLVKAFAPLVVARDARDRDLDAAAQTIADAMTSFVRARPTQWFHFRPD
jgi:KDO2-lipid IV(A) lauroyltransferase